MGNSFSEYFFSLKDGKLTLSVWGFLVVIIVAWLALVLLIAAIKHIKFKKRERAYFEKYFKRVERDESLDRSIDILEKNDNERSFIKINEVSPNGKREYTFELKDGTYCGSSFSKCGVFINDEDVDEVHFSLTFSNSKLELKTISQEKEVDVYKTNLLGIKKVHHLKKPETIFIKSGDMIRVGKTSLNISIFSNINGII